MQFFRTAYSALFSSSSFFSTFTFGLSSFGLAGAAFAGDFLGDIIMIILLPSSAGN